MGRITHFSCQTKRASQLHHPWCLMSVNTSIYKMTSILKLYKYMIFPKVAVPTNEFHDR
jgi:hypothetical protein